MKIIKPDENSNIKGVKPINGYIYRFEDSLIYKYRYDNHELTSMIIIPNIDNIYTITNLP